MHVTDRKKQDFGVGLKCSVLLYDVSAFGTTHAKAPTKAAIESCRLLPIVTASYPTLYRW